MSAAFFETKLGRILKSPQTTLLGGFGLVILAGAILLWFPCAQRTGGVGFVDALFTSTSAVCVTGLSVVDTGKDYTLFGQIVIMLLIQIGGLGIMSFAALAFQLLGGRMPLQWDALLSDSFYQRDAAREIKQSFRTILTLTFAIEGAAAFLLFVLLLPLKSTGDALFSAVFHSVSAFCNAGFSLETDNLIAFKDHTWILAVIMSLIVLGGLGFFVLQELWTLLNNLVRRTVVIRPRLLSLHARLVLVVSGGLIAGGCLLMVVTRLVPGAPGLFEDLIHSLFQSVSARTAGFNTVDLGNASSASLFALMVLMFVGGSPASCAGGVKTTSVAVWTARIRAILAGNPEVRIGDRSIGADTVNRVDLLLALAALWNALGVLLLLVAQHGTGMQAIDLAFEQISAFGTVGLSTGVTAKLSTFSKLWVCATMFVGRLGPLTVAMWAFPRAQTNIRYPRGSVMIG
jgi:trk system potassium uptake protein TrkH